VRLTDPPRLTAEPAGESLADDLLVGAAAIAMFLYGNASASNRNKIYHASGPKVSPHDRLPLFHMGGLVLHGRKSTIRQWISRKEAEAVSEAAE
jgi:hypothetical protein